MFERIIFYFFAVLLLVSASMVVTVKNPIHAALFLVMSFFCSAAIWLLLQAEFLAIVLVLVYVGAVMVLFLFVVMMLDIDLVMIREGFARYLPVGLFVAVCMAIVMVLVAGSDYFLSDNFMRIEKMTASADNTRSIGLILYKEYLYQFEIAGAILLVAIIASISLGMNKAKVSKTKHPDDQVFVKKQDRLKMIKMPTENKKHDYPA